jgi:hypothetical protein
LFFALLFNLSYDNSTGVEEKTGCIVERPGRGVKHICGTPILDNHSVNLISSIIMGLMTPWLANILWV